MRMICEQLSSVCDLYCDVYMNMFANKYGFYNNNNNNNNNNNKGPVLNYKILYLCFLWKFLNDILTYHVTTEISQVICIIKNIVQVA